MQERKKILILDDEPEMLELLERILSKYYIVQTRNSITNFEFHLLEFKPNLLLVDHFIGDDTSNDVIRQSLTRLQIPFILHSAHEEIEKLSKETQASAFLKKPSSIKEIRECVDAVLREA